MHITAGVCFRESRYIPRNISLFTLNHLMALHRHTQTHTDTHRHAQARTQAGVNIGTHVLRWAR